MIPTNAIRPEVVAQKLAAADNRSARCLADELQENPRLVELMWFVQWYDAFAPGGRGQLARDVIMSQPDAFYSAAMREAGHPACEGRYDVAQCLTVWHSEARAPEDKFECCRPLPNILEDGESPPTRSLPSELETLSYRDFLLWFIDGKATPEDARGNGSEARAIRFGLDRFNFQFLQERCLAEAQQRLPQYLADLCERLDIGFGCAPSWGRGLVPALLALMEQHVQRERARLAMTEVAIKVHDALDYAWAEKKLVRVTGSARFGKTESVKAWASMYPGRARLVTVPCSNSVADLICAVAESLGMAVSYGSRSAELRSRVEFILRHGRLGILADESHFLFPVRFGNTTSPDRLNWIRQNIVDRGLPCALVSTPQAYEGQRKRFDRATSYNMEQWSGRLAMSLELPDRLSVEDMRAVASLHFPELRESLVAMAVGAAKQSQSYLKAIADIASRARWLASKRGASAIALRDLEAAIQDVVPRLSNSASEAVDHSQEPVVAIPQPRGRTAAETLQEICTNRMSPRKPASREGETMTRSAAELVPA